MFGFLRKIVEHKKIVFMCSDPRFVKDFDAFIYSDLGLVYKEFSPITIPGSAIALAFPDSIIEDVINTYNCSIRYIKFLTNTFPSFDTAILTVHEDCGWLRIADCYGKGMEEQILHLAGINVTKLFPQLNVELYYGRKKQRRHRRLAFERINQQAPIMSH